MFLARKIARAKWDKKAGLGPDEIPADAITIDLRTRDNALSFYRCGSASPSEVEEAALAIAAAGDHIETFDVAWISSDDLRARGHELKDIRGETPLVSMRERHVDVCRLDHRRLGEVAETLAAALCPATSKRFTKSSVETLLLDAVKQGRVEREQLKDGLKKVVEREVPLEK